MKTKDWECSSVVQLLPGMCEDLGSIQGNPLSKRDQYRTFYGTSFFGFGLVWFLVLLLLFCLLGLGRLLIFCLFCFFVETGFLYIITSLLEGETSYEL
jgi:hypothetical protein